MGLIGWVLRVMMTQSRELSAASGVTLCHVRSQLPDRLAGCSGPACKSAQPIAKLLKVGQKLSANQLTGIFRIRPYRTPIRLTYASPPPLAYARYGGFASVRLLGEQKECWKCWF